MSSLEKDKTDLVTTNVKWRWPSVHPEGRKFAVIAFAIAALFWWVIDWDWLGYLAFALTLGIGAFFRDPVRTTPVGQGLIGMRERVALLDGTVSAGPTPEGGYLVHALIPVGEEVASGDRGHGR